MTSGYPHSPHHYNNRNSNTLSTPNLNNGSTWNHESLALSGRGEEIQSLTLPPISSANSGNRLELSLPRLPSSPLFVPETHPRPVQAPGRSYGPASTSNINSNATTTASASTSAIISTSQSAHINHPRSLSPPDRFSFDPWDESNRYPSPPPPLLPPLSNQVAQPIPQQSARSSSFYNDDAEGLADFDWDSLLSQANHDLDDPFASPPGMPSRIPSRASNTYGVVDLTDSSPTMSPPATRRRALSRSGLRPAALSLPQSPKRQKSRASPSSKPSKRRKLSAAKIDPDEDVEVVDLAANSNLQEYEVAKAKRQEDLIKQQNQDEATKPVKLVDFQCIICMDNPTDLTVTHCGHLFCSECLHSALHAGNNGKKSCPVCRTTVSTATAHNRRPPKNGTFPISIKLMTANKMGKKPTKSG